MALVQGMASSRLFTASDPTSPMNRRISIIVLNKEAEDRLLRIVPNQGEPGDAAESGGGAASGEGAGSGGAATGAGTAPGGGGEAPARATGGPRLGSFGNGFGR